MITIPPPGRRRTSPGRTAPPSPTAARRPATRCPSLRAIPTQSSMLTPLTGTNGTTSDAPMRGCSPVCRLRSISCAALAIALRAASSTPTGGPAKVTTLRLWSASLLLDDPLGPLHIDGIVVAYQPVDDKGLEELECHALGQATLVQRQLRADYDDRPARIVHALTQQVAAEASLLAFQHVAQRLQLAATAAALAPPPSTGPPGTSPPPAP